MVAGFTSWHDIGPLFLYTFAFFLFIIIISVVLDKKNILEQFFHKGGRGKTMKGGGESNVSKLVNLFLLIGVIILFIIIIVAVSGGGDVLGILGGGGGGKRI
jgi:hypothetical protein